jgi:hypothetical protein
MSTMDRLAWNENEDYGGSIIDEDDAIVAVGGGGGDDEEARTRRGASVQGAEAGAPDAKRTNGAVEASNGAEREAKRPRYDFSKEAEGAVKVLADRILRFVTSSTFEEEEAAKRAVVQFFQEERNFASFEERGDFLWRGREFCEAICRGRYGPRARSRLAFLGRPAPALRSFSSLVECLLTIALWNLAREGCWRTSCTCSTTSLHWRPTTFTGSVVPERSDDCPYEVHNILRMHESGGCQ